MPMQNEKFVDVDGVRTRYFEEGTGEPMLLLHGGNFGQADNVDCANNWDLNWDGFVKNFHVFAIDRLGQGYTDNPKPGGYLIENVIAHIRGFIRDMNFEKLHLVGHSRGGYMSSRITREDPARILTLTIIDSSTTAPGANLFRGPLLAKAPRPLRSRESLAWVTRQFSYSDSLNTKDWMDVREAIGKMPKNDEAVTEAGKMYDSTFLPGLEKQKDDTLAWIKDRNLKQPTLLVWGKNDPSAVLAGGLELFDIVSGSTPKAQMHIFNQAGHYSYREHPHGFVEVVTGFIRSI
jgi:2-hydroxy-6-oxo-6-(2'-carboxyphenyl)-hexa-2,4-dienoate hydrolase